MINRYHELYNKMVSSKDPKNMQIFGEAEMYIFENMAMQQPDKAENWLSHLEAVGWRNYLSEREAQNIGKRIRNSDGTSGVHWQHDTFVKAVEVLGGKTEDMPYYNSYALCIVANMMYSDHAISIANDMGYDVPGKIANDKMALSCYRKAVEVLRDIDDNFRVRDYFKNKMYDNSPM